MSTWAEGIAGFRIWLSGLLVLRANLDSINQEGSPFQFECHTVAKAAVLGQTV